MEPDIWRKTELIDKLNFQGFFYDLLSQISLNLEHKKEEKHHEELLVNVQ